MGSTNWTEWVIFLRQCWEWEYIEGDRGDVWGKIGVDVIIFHCIHV